MKRLLCLVALFAAPAFAASAQTPRGAPHAGHGLTFSRPDWVSVAVNVAPPGPVGVGGGRGRGAAFASRNEPAHIRQALVNARNIAFPAPTASGGWQRGMRHASVAVTNDGTKAVKSLRFDFVFRDPATGAEVNRIRHRSRKRLRPGATASTTKEVMGSARHSRGDGMDVSVEVTEVVYDDGTVWERR